MVEGLRRINSVAIRRGGIEMSKMFGVTNDIVNMA